MRIPFFALIFFLISNSHPSFAFSLIPVGSYTVSNLTTGSNNSSSSLTGTGGGTIAQNSFDSGTKIGLGLLVSSPISTKLSVEFGMLYLPRNMTANYSISGNSSNLNGSYSEIWDFKYLQFPLLVRYFFSPEFSIGLGAYYATKIGKLQESTGFPSGVNSINNIGTDNSLSYGSGGAASSDYGLLAAAGVKFPFYGSRTSFYFDARYLYGLQNIAIPTNTPLGFTKFSNDSNHWRDYQLLVGISVVYGHGSNR